MIADRRRFVHATALALVLRVSMLCFAVPCCSKQLFLLKQHFGAHFQKSLRCPGIEKQCTAKLFRQRMHSLLRAPCRACYLALQQQVVKPALCSFTCQHVLLWCSEAMTYMCCAISSKTGRHAVKRLHINTVHSDTGKDVSSEQRASSQ